MVLVVDSHQKVQNKKRKRKPKALKNDKSDFKGLGEININGKKIDLLYLVRDASDDFEANLNKMTEGMVKEAEFMGVLKDLEGVWSSKKKRRMFVKATIFGDALPENWRILLAFLPRVYLFSLYCCKFDSWNTSSVILMMEDIMIDIMDKRETSELLNLALESTMKECEPPQPPTTFPATIPRFEEKSGESYTSSKVVKDSRFLSDDVTKVADSLREQGEDDWQPPYEPDLQDIQDTPDCCNLKPHMDVIQEGRACSKLSYCSFGPVLRCDNVLHLMVVQGLGSNYKRSGLGFYYTMILVVHLEPNILYGPFFEQMMTWDSGIT
ncbi:ankyrin repeat-containing protein [Tanacetum coccineum]